MTNILPSTEPISNSANPVQNVTPPIDVAPAPVTPAGTPQKRNYLSWLLGILVLVVVLAASFLILASKSKPTLTDSLIQPSVSPEQTTVADTSIDMSSWKTYTNKQAGFTLKYPSTWRENDISSIDFGTPVLAAIDLDSDPQNPLPYESFGDSIRLIVYQNPNNLTTDEFVKKEAFKNETRDKNFDYGNYKKGTQYDFYGLKGTKIENVEAPPGERGPSIFIPKDNFILSISTMNTSATNQKILNEALYTFEFTDASLVSFVKNKLKSSDESGISIKIVDGDYAKGTAGTAGGCNWFAAKKDGVWHSFLCINGTASCSDAEPFPARFLPVCYDSQNNLIYRNVSVKYNAPADYGSITFEHPDTFPVELQGDQINIPNIGQGIIISKFDINNFDYSQDPRITRESMQNYYRELQHGKLSGKSYYSMWTLDASDKIKQTNNAKFFRTGVTFSAFEVCDFKFYTSIEIPIQNKFIDITIYGDVKKIRDSLYYSDLLKQYEGCSETSFAEGAQQKFYDLLTNGGGEPEAKEWFDAANKVINSLNF